MNKEKPVFLERSAWWAQVGGAVAGVVGVLNRWIDVTGAGVVLFVGGTVVKDQFSKARKNAASSYT